MNKNLLIRSAVGLLGIPLLLFLPFAGLIYYAMLIYVISYLGAKELNSFLKAKDLTPNRFLPLFTAIIPLVVFNLGFSNISKYMVIIFLLLAFIELFRNKGNAFGNMSGYAFTIIYAGFFPASLIEIHRIAGAEMIILILTVIWATDIFAYFGGMICSRLFTTHKLFFRVSPKKTIEGAVSGLIFGLGTGYLFYLFWGEASGMLLIDAVIVSLICSILGQAGDLFESLLKRDCHIKDSSNIIPGHGGILDRFDSLIFVSPMILFYLSTVWIQN